MLSTSIVVAVDLSESSLPALRAAAWLCRELAGSATLMYAVEPEFTLGALEHPKRNEASSLAGYAYAYIADVQRDIFEGVGTEIRIVENARDASEAICDVAEAMRSQLVVMGTHGRTAVELVAFGSTATSVVRHATCDVLTVRPPAEGDPGLDVKLADWVLSEGQVSTIRNILCPIDFSPGADKALQRAAGLAKQFGSKLTLLNAVDPPFWAKREEYTLAAAKLRAEARENMDHAVASTRDAGVEVDGLVEEGGAAPTILRVAEETHADLVVMGTHGRTGLKRWTIGSVAERTVRSCPVPVWTVRVS